MKKQKRRRRYTEFYGCDAGKLVLSAFMRDSNKCDAAAAAVVAINDDLRDAYNMRMVA